MAPASTNWALGVLRSGWSASCYLASTVSENYTGVGAISCDRDPGNGPMRTGWCIGTLECTRVQSGGYRPGALRDLRLSRKHQARHRWPVRCQRKSFMVVLSRPTARPSTGSGLASAVCRRTGYVALGTFLQVNLQDGRLTKAKWGTKIINWV